MVIVHDFDKHKYNLPAVGSGLSKKVHQNPSCCGVSSPCGFVSSPCGLVSSHDGEGIISSIVDGVKSGVDLAVKNKDLISTVGKSANSVAGAASKISEAVKAAQRLNELKELQKIKAVQQAKSELPSEVKQAIQSVSRNPKLALAVSKSGDGFEKF